MQSLHVHDCSLTFSGYYRSPCLLEALDLETTTSALLRDFSTYGLQAAGITLDRGDGLFAYSLKTQLFNGLISFSQGSTGVTGAFSRLLRSSDRTLAESTLKAFLNICGDRLAETSFFQIDTHAGFRQTEERDAFFSRDTANGLTLNGVLGYKKMEDPSQMIRLEIDQSWVYSDAAFIVWKTIGMKHAAIMSAGPLWDIFFPMLTPFDIGLSND